MPQPEVKSTPWVSPLAKADDEDRWTHVLSRLNERAGVICNATDLVRFEARIRLAEGQRAVGQPYPIVFPQFAQEDEQRGKQYWRASMGGVSWDFVVDKSTLKIISVRAKPETAQ